MIRAILGKIVSITPKEDAPARRYEIGFRATCVLPKRTPPPEWLKDQTLKLERRVDDLRELGHPGDSIVLTPAESARWLCPLAVTPSISRGEVPKTLRLELRWWKVDDPPEYTVRTNGAQISGKWTKDGGGFLSEVDTTQLLASAPRLPVDFEVTCDKLKVVSSALTGDRPYWKKLTLPEGEVHRVENDWFTLDATPSVCGGGIVALREKGRGIDHFDAARDRVGLPLENGGHCDKLRRGWRNWDRLETTAMNTASASREGGAIRLRLEGVIDEGEGARTTVSYSVYDDIPLIILRRDYSFAAGKKKEDEKDKEKAEAPKEPIDEVLPLALGFRAAWAREGRGGHGSRLLCGSGKRLMVVRCGRTHEFFRTSAWTMDQGWVIIEHPIRRENTMYLLDPQSAPYLRSWLGQDSITLEPAWCHTVVRPGESIGLTLAICAGELCGASEQGAWVACRAATPDGVKCGVVMRSRQAGQTSARITLGEETRDVAMSGVLIPGLGTVAYASAGFPNGHLDDEFDVIAGEINARRTR